MRILLRLIASTFLLAACADTGPDPQGINGAGEGGVQSGFGTVANGGVESGFGAEGAGSEESGFGTAASGGVSSGLGEGGGSFVSTQVCEFLVTCALNAPTEEYYVPGFIAQAQALIDECASFMNCAFEKYPEMEAFFAQVMEVSYCDEDGLQTEDAAEAGIEAAFSKWENDAVYQNLHECAQQSDFGFWTYIF